MLVRATVDAPVDTAADTVAVGVFDGKRIPHDIDDGALQALLDSGEARTSFKHLAVTHAAGDALLPPGVRLAYDGLVLTASS